MPILAEGAEEAKRITDELKSSSGFYRLKDLVIKDGEGGFYRVATERTKLITISVHRFADTKPKPDECTWDNWPKMMWAVCPNDKAFRLRDSSGNLTDQFEEGYGDCYIHATRLGKKVGKYKKDAGLADTMTYGIVVPQVPITASGRPDDPAIIGFKDETVEYKDKDGKVWQIPALHLACQRFSNFWHPIEATSFMSPRTICNKVYAISRKDKDYTIGVVLTDPEVTDPSAPAAAKRYAEALELVGFKLGDYLLETAKRDHYRKFFIEGELPEGGYSKKDSDGEAEEGASEEAAQEAAPSTPALDMAAMDAYRARLSNRGAN